MIGHHMFCLFYILLLVGFLVLLYQKSPKRWKFYLVSKAAKKSSPKWGHIVNSKLSAQLSSITAHVPYWDCEIVTGNESEKSRVSAQTQYD